MNAFRYKTASLIAADPRLASLFSTQFTTGSAPFSGHPRWRTLLATVATPPSLPTLEIETPSPVKSIAFGFPPQQKFDFAG
jgi:hypothetical protein